MIKEMFSHDMILKKINKSISFLSKLENHLFYMLMSFQKIVLCRVAFLQQNRETTYPSRFSIFI